MKTLKAILYPLFSSTILILNSCGIKKETHLTPIENQNINIQKETQIQDTIKSPIEETEFSDKTKKIEQVNIVNSDDSLKIGIFNSQEVIKKMPEYNTAMSELENINLRYQKEIKILQNEFENKYKEYLSISDTEIKKIKEDELLRIQQSMQEFSTHAENSIKEKQQELFNPIINKINLAVKKIGDDNNFTYIIDSSVGVVPYISTDAEDIFPLLKQALNLE